MRVAVGSDHRGFLHKEAISTMLKGLGWEVTDCGCPGPESADYPDAAFPAAELVAAGRVDAGILICGSGVGMSIAANKVHGIRASLCFTPEQATTTVQHNDSNILCLSGDAMDPAEAVTLAKSYLGATFEGGRHARRVAKITAYENDHRK